MPHRSDERLSELIAKKVLPNYPSESVLDIGCGDGVVGRHLPERCKYTGLDITEACIYERQHDNPEVRYVQAERIPNLMSSEGPWDTVLLLDVLEHTRGFTPLFKEALQNARSHVVVSLPNELFIMDRLRMLKGHELNAHSLDLTEMPEGFKHQYIINIEKAERILDRAAEEVGYRLVERILRPLTCKKWWQRSVMGLTMNLCNPSVWSMGTVFVYGKERRG